MSNELKNMLDLPTLEFLLRLKAVNIYWYFTLIRCAKRGPKVTQQCIEEACKYITYTKLSSENVNVFQICKASNQGLLGESTFDGFINQMAIEVYRQKFISRYRESNSL